MWKKFESAGCVGEDVIDGTGSVAVDVAGAPFIGGEGGDVEEALWPGTEAVVAGDEGHGDEGDIVELSLGRIVWKVW